jgi:hypothetical protein
MIPPQLQSMHLHNVNSDIQFEALAFVRAQFHHSSILVGVVENSRSVFHNGANTDSIKFQSILDRNFFLF